MRFAHPETMPARLPVDVEEQRGPSMAGPPNAARRAPTARAPAHEPCSSPSGPCALPDVVRPNGRGKRPPGPVGPETPHHEDTECRYS